MVVETFDKRANIHGSITTIDIFFPDAGYRVVSVLCPLLEKELTIF